MVGRSGNTRQNPRRGRAASAQPAADPPVVRETDNTHEADSDSASNTGGTQDMGDLPEGGTRLVEEPGNSPAVRVAIQVSRPWTYCHGLLPDKVFSGYRLRVMRYVLLILLLFLLCCGY